MSSKLHNVLGYRYFFLCKLQKMRKLYWIVWKWYEQGNLHGIYTITYKSKLTQKKLYKKTDAIFSIYGKNGIIPWHFF